MTYEEVRELNDYGTAVLYKLSEGVEFSCEGYSSLTTYVIVSSIEDDVTNETYIFPSDCYGEVISWRELAGSYQGGTGCHETALNGLGFCKEIK